MRILNYTLFFIMLLTQLCFTQWTRKADMPTARWGLSACTLDDKIFVIGGSKSTGAPGYGLAVMEVYDPVLDIWDTTKAPMPTPRVMFMAAAVNGKIYAIGGREVWETGNDLGTLEEYDPLTDNWTTKTPMPKPRSVAGVSVYNDKIYISGGISGGSAFIYTNDLQIYNPVDDTWDTTKSAMNYIRDPFACTLNNFVFVIGGTDGPPYDGLHIVEAYEILSDTWTEKAPTKDGRKAASVDALEGKIYAAGGEDIAEPVRSVEVYDPDEDNWTIIAETPIWYSVHTSAVYQGKIYLIGGSVTGARYEIYTPTPITYSFEPGFAYTTSLNISDYYIPEQGDTLKITAVLENIENHQTVVYVLINDEISVFNDSVLLYDDGLHNDEYPNDNIYGGEKWFYGLQEDFYVVKVYCKDLTAGTTHLLKDYQYFTTAGPLKVDSIAYGSLSNFRYSVKPFIKNEGSTLTINNIQVELYSNDPWVTQVFPTFRTCSDIQPDQIKSPSQAFAVSYDSASFPGYFNLEFRITSGGINYWTEEVNLIVTGVNDRYDQPTEYYLSQNFPNPFNPSTKITYSIPARSNVYLKVFNLLGSEVGEIVNGEIEQGTYHITFNVSNLPSGVYFYRLQAGNFVQTRKMILLK